jgi:hypothetical protein
MLKESFVGLISRKPELAKSLPPEAIETVYSGIYNRRERRYSDVILIKLIAEQGGHEQLREQIEGWHEYAKQVRQLQDYEFVVDVCDATGLELPLDEVEIDSLFNSYFRTESNQRIEQLQRMTGRKPACDINEMKSRLEKLVEEEVYSKLSEAEGKTERERKDNVQGLRFQFDHIKRLLALTGMDHEYDENRVQELFQHMIKYGNMPAIKSLSNGTGIKPIFKEKARASANMRKALMENDFDTIGFLIEIGIPPEESAVREAYYRIGSGIERHSIYSLLKLFGLTGIEPGEATNVIIENFVRSADKFSALKGEMKELAASSGIKIDTDKIKELCRELFDEENYYKITAIKEALKIDPGLDPDKVQERYRIHYNGLGEYGYDRISSLHEASGVPPEPKILAKLKLYENDISGALHILKEHKEIIEKDDAEVLGWLESLQKQEPA